MTPLKKDGRHSKYNPAVVTFAEYYERYYKHGVQSLEEELAITRAALEFELQKPIVKIEVLLPVVDRIERIITNIRKVQAVETVAEAVAPAGMAFAILQKFCNFVTEALVKRGANGFTPLFMDLSHKYLEELSASSGEQP